MRVSLYTRVSTEDQVREGTSLEVQREFLVEFAKRQGWDVFGIYTDEGISGYTTDRPAFKRMMADARKKKFDSIIVYKMDRFSRKLKDALNIVDELEAIGVGFKSATEPFDTTNSSGKLMFQQLGSFAEFERNRIKERVFPGMLKGVERGNWQGARYVPYGYRYNKHDPEKKLIIVKEEADVIKLIYVMYLSGQSTTQIAGYLYNKEYKTRSGGKFHSKLVCDMLKRKLYIGIIEWNRHHYDKKQKTLKGYKYVRNEASKVVSGKGKHEAIICEEDFYAVQKKLANNRNGVSVRKGSADYPLTGILICGNCGHRMQGCLSIASRENKMTKGKRRYYRCCGRAVHYVECYEGSVQAEKIEEEVYAIIDVVLSNPELDEKRLDNLASILSTSRNDEIEKDISEIDKKLKGNISSQEKLGKAFSDSLIAHEAFKNLILPLRDEQREFEENRQRLKLSLIEREKSEEYQRMLKAVINHFDFIKEDLDATGRKGLLRLMFKRIVIANCKIKEFELYEPFKSLYEGRGIKWEVIENQRVMENPGCVSTYALSDAK
jgi:site-specific DNA recombinase